MAALLLVIVIAMSAPVRTAQAQDMPWAGTYANGEVTYTLSGSGGSLSGTGVWTPAGGDHAKQGVDATLGSCTASGASATCTSVSGHYVDPDKAIDYQATATLALSGNTLMVITMIDSATPQWKPNVAPYTLAIHAGASFTDIVERKSPAPPPQVAPTSQPLASTDAATNCQPGGLRPANDDQAYEGELRVAQVVDPSCPGVRFTDRGLNITLTGGEPCEPSAGGCTPGFNGNLTDLTLMPAECDWAGKIARTSGGASDYPETWDELLPPGWVMVSGPDAEPQLVQDQGDTTHLIGALPVTPQWVLAARNKLARDINAAIADIGGDCDRYRQEWNHLARNGATPDMSQAKASLEQKAAQIERARALLLDIDQRMGLNAEGGQ